MLAAQDVTLATGRVVSLRVGQGEGIVIRGRSGAGKSLLLRRLADLDPGAGRITLDGRCHTTLAASDYRKHVALVPAEPAFWHATLADHASNADFAEVDLCATRTIAPIETLSSGERMRAAIAITVARRPKVLLLDEPTGPLDPASTGLIEGLILRLATSGTAILLTSHDPDQARRLGFAAMDLE